MNDKTAKILIVDDSFVNRNLLQEILRSSHPDYIFCFAEDGVDALKKVEECNPDIIILDIMMPNLDGFEVCKRLKSDEKYKNIPILMITALDKVQDKVTGLKLGASDYIIKPINDEEAKARVEAHLRIKWYQDELKEINEKLSKAQSALIESAKMSAIGSLTAGISHEFNNILCMIAGYTHLLKKTDKPEDVKESISAIEELIFRGKEIVQSLLHFSRGVKKDEKKECNLKELIEHDLLLLKKYFSDNKIEIISRINEVPIISCYTAQISQILFNLAKNSAEAMSESANKIFTVELLFIESSSFPEIEGTIIKHGDPRIIIKISDTGSGIPRKIKNKIFEPFVSTKAVLSGGNSNVPGTGLGLSIVYGIVRRHDGSITFETEEGKGTMFIITLPVNVSAA